MKLNDLDIDVDFVSSLLFEDAMDRAIDPVGEWNYVFAPNAKKALKTKIRVPRIRKSLTAILEIIASKGGNIAPEDFPTALKVHPLRSKTLKGKWGAHIESNKTIMVFSIDRDAKDIIVYDVGDHKIYESYDDDVVG